MGAGILKNFVVTIDQAQKTIRFARSGNSPLEIPSPRTLGIGILKRGGNWRVVDILPDRGAEKLDVRLGDIIVRVNGRNAADLAKDDWTKLIDTRDSLTLDLVRRARTLQVEAAIFPLLPGNSDR